MYGRPTRCRRSSRKMASLSRGCCGGRWSRRAPARVKTKKPWINATVEGLRSKGSYFGVKPDVAHRALILADGFYEWPKPEDEKAKAKLKPPPMRFTVEGERVFCFAGLWVTARHVEGGPVASCTIITCGATGNRVVAPVHDRMPVILADPDVMRAWLDPGDLPRGGSVSMRAARRRSHVQRNSPPWRRERRYRTSHAAGDLATCSRVGRRCSDLGPRTHVE